MSITWAANLLLLLGLYLNGNRNRLCFLFTVTGEVIWTTVAALRGQWDLAFICAVFGLMAVRGWYLWGRDNDR